MQIFNSHDDIRIERQSVVALGNFDGVHIGHRVILEDAIRIAGETGAKAVCYTFSNHPVNFFRKRAGREDECIKLICTEEKKLAMLEKMGFDVVINVPFDEQTMSMRALTFIDEILDGKCHAAAVCCGFNYSFGVKAEGNVDFLIEECTKRGIDVHVHDAVEIDGKVVSSTEIRRLIAEGDMEKCNALLGRAYTLRGTVSHGEKLGTELGFPTMNFDAPTYMALPPNGVYFTRAIVGDKVYPAITNIGVKPTVGGKFKSVETNIFDFKADIYGKDVSVEFLKFERPEMKFESVEELRQMIAKNVESAIDYHKVHTV